MPVKYHSSEPFVRRVPTWKMHLFTCTQVAALALLWTVAQSRFSLAFPFFLVMMVPLRHKLASYFSASELTAVRLHFLELVEHELNFLLFISPISTAGWQQTRSGPRRRARLLRASWYAAVKIMYNLKGEGKIL